MSVETIEGFDGPWLDERPSIHSLVIDALAKRGLANEELHIELPCENAAEIRWAPGALDSLSGYADSSLRQTSVRRLITAINNTLRRPSKNNAAHLYKLLCETDTISIVDATLSRVMDDIGDRRAALAALSRRLILESPDVEPVKAGVALLGVSGIPDDAVLISAVGCYEEITLYSVVALRNLLADAEHAIWELAKRVHGWGRIQTVERLIGTKNADIRAWMLRSGFRNCIMYEYLACACATTGGLQDAISSHEIDDELLLAVGEILSALVRGGPAESIEDYPDGPSACVAFLRHVATKPVRDVRVIDAALQINKLGESERAEQLRGRPGWSAQVLLDIRSLVNAILQSAEVKAITQEGLASEDFAAFQVAAEIAPSFGIDPWPLRLERQRARHSDQWYWLMQTDDSSRIEKVLALAREQLNLEAIGSGPTTSLGLGPEFKDDSALEFVLQDLKRFPGKGWDLIKVGLCGRVMRMRNMAINALRDWGKEAWPSEAMEELRLATEREPDEKVRERMRDLVRGQLRG
jgi:hypothetical protein